jgi:hypothetical protein
MWVGTTDQNGSGWGHVAAAALWELVLHFTTPDFAVPLTSITTKLAALHIDCPMAPFTHICAAILASPQGADIQADTHR